MKIIKYKWDKKKKIKTKRVFYITSNRAFNSLVLFGKLDRYSTSKKIIKVVLISMTSKKKYKNWKMGF